MTKRLFSVIISVLLLSLCLAGCGGNTAGNDPVQTIAAEYAEKINGELDDLNSPQYTDRLQFSASTESSATYTCEDSTVVFGISDGALVDVTVQNDAYSFLSTATANALGVNTGSLSNEQSMVIMALSDGSFDTDKCEVSYTASTGLVFKIK